MQKGAALATVLRQIQRAKGVETSALAEAADIDVSTMRSVLNGQILCPPVRRLTAWAQVLEITTDELRRAAERDGCQYRTERAARAADQGGRMYRKGQTLASTLEDAISAIDQSGDDDRSRADVVDQMASAANIDRSTVNDILSAEIVCPPRERLNGFASVDGLPSFSDLTEAAAADGCDEQSGSATPNSLSKSAKAAADDLRLARDMIRRRLG